MKSANNAVILAEQLETMGIDVATISWGGESYELIKNNSDLFTFHGSHEDVVKSVEDNHFNNDQLVEEEINLERKLGCLKKYIFADRFLCNCFHEDVYTNNLVTDDVRLAYIIHWARYLENIIQRYNVYSIISYTSSSAPMLLAADLVRLHGGCYTQMVPTRLPDRLAFCDGYNEEDLIKLNQSVSIDEITNTLKNTAKKDPTWAKTDYSPAKMVTILRKGFDIITGVDSDIKKIKSPFYFDLSLTDRITNYLVKRWWDFKGFAYNNYDMNENHISYFMHVVPEAAVSVHAQYYEDEYSIIVNIARSLPPGVALYVKDHPHMQWKRDRKLYFKIKRIPSVRILAPDIPVTSFVENSLICITKTGTAALQAFWAGRPSLVFGDAYYNHANGIHRFNEPMPLLQRSIYDLIGKVVDKDDQFSFMEYLLQNSLDISAEKFLGSEGLSRSDATLMISELRNAGRL